MGVTVVVVLYGERVLSRECLEALVRLDHESTPIMIIDDRPYSSRPLSEEFFSILSGSPHIRCVRHKEPRGFIACCREAVFDLDATDNDILLLDGRVEIDGDSLDILRQALHEHERHGIVMPRCNARSWFGIVPEEDIPDRQDFLRRCDALRPILHPLEIVPYGDRFCMLIRRTLIRNFGLLETLPGCEGDADGAGSERDFSLRINQRGYSIVVANRAAVFIGDVTDRPLFPRLKPDSPWKNALKSHYPWIEVAEKTYEVHTIDPVLRFSGVLEMPAPPTKIRLLYSLHHLHPAYNGTSEYALSLLDEWLALFGEKYEITLLTNPEADAFHGLSRRYPRVVYEDTIHETYHVAYVPFQLFFPETLVLCNRYAARIVFCNFDIIMLRCYYIAKQTGGLHETATLSMLYTDGIVTISDFTRRDLLAYFAQEHVQEQRPPIAVIHLGIHDYKRRRVGRVPGLPGNEYIMVIGNHFAHKCLAPALDLLAHRCPHRHFVVIGSGVESLDMPTVTTYASGRLDETFIEALYEGCRLVVFPSHYEGFGLPILHGLIKGKPVIACDNGINRELMETVASDCRDRVRLFNDFSELPALIDELLAADAGEPVVAPVLRNWTDVSRETERFVDSILAKPIDIRRLRMRWAMVSAISETMDVTHRWRQAFQYYRDHHHRAVEVIREQEALLRRVTGSFAYRWAQFFKKLPLVHSLFNVTIVPLSRLWRRGCVRPE